MNKQFWKNKNVFITGNTGFKGSWLSIWLNELGANVTGYSLFPETNPSIFQTLSIDKKVKTVFGDIRNYDECNLILGFNISGDLNLEGELEELEELEESFENGSGTDVSGDYDFVTNLQTKNINHNVGDIIDIDYNIKDPKKIREHINFKIYLIIAFVVLFLFLINIYIRTALYENDTVKAYIGITCIRSMLSIDL